MAYAIKIVSPTSVVFVGDHNRWTMCEGDAHKWHYKRDAEEIAAWWRNKLSYSLEGGYKVSVVKT